LFLFSTDTIAYRVSSVCSVFLLYLSNYLSPIHSDQLPTE